MTKTIGKVLAGLAALGALALGGAALAGAATKAGTAASQSTQVQPMGYGDGPPPGGRGPGGPGPGGPHGGHVGRNGQRETLLTGDTATKVRDAALAKVPGGTVERVETDADHGSPYEAHIRKSDGTELEVLVNKDFQVTAVNTMQHP
jgi:uncharacterized membrane protein YkoI